MEAHGKFKAKVASRQKKVFIICSVRIASPSYRKKLEAYANCLEDDGYEVHLPHRDTDQTASGFNICLESAATINFADEVHIFYNEKSTGTHFDMGVLFALQVIMEMDKKIVIVEGAEWTDTKSFKRMLMEWEKYQNGEEIE